MKYFVHDVVGNIVSHGDCQEENLPLMGGPGLTVVAGEADCRRHYLVDGVVTEYDAEALARHAQNPGFGFRWSLGQWIDERSLDQAKAQKWVAIKACREAAEFSTFTHNGLTFDCDPVSTSRIMGAVQMAQMALMAEQPFSLEWTLADNTVAVLGATDLVVVGQALATHVNAQHIKARGLRDEIQAASNSEELALISW